MNQILCYESPSNVYDCIAKITKKPQQYASKWGFALRYKANKLSDTQVLITFTGGRFRKMMRTRYLMEFLPQGNHTRIVLWFQKELLGLPIPMTSPLDIDLCMKQKLNAERRSTGDGSLS